MNRKDLTLKIGIGFFLICAIVLTTIDIHFVQDDVVNEYIVLILYLVSSGLFLLLGLRLAGYVYLLNFKINLKIVLILLPGLIIAINNFPISAYLNGRTELLHSNSMVLLFLVVCFATGFAEEILFRIIILMIFLQRLPKSKQSIFKAVIYSSALFGFMHVFNLFVGAGVGNTLLQIGYSFLMGMLFAVLYIKTKNIWLVMILHGLYNFFGQVMFELGSVANRYDTITVVITILLGLVVAIYAFKLLLDTEPSDIKEIYEPN